MAYQNNIPQPNDRLSISQADLLNNFAAIQTLIDVNHYSFASPNSGKHLYLQLPETTAPTTAANEAGLYAVQGPVSTVTELAFRRESNGSSIVFTEGSLATSGWTRLPSGLLLQWGTGNASGGAGTTNTFPKAFATACYNVQMTETTASTGNNRTFLEVYGTPTTTNFKAQAWTPGGVGVAATIYWFAVGV